MSDDKYERATVGTLAIVVIAAALCWLGVVVVYPTIPYGTLGVGEAAFWNFMKVCLVAALVIAGTVLAFSVPCAIWDVVTGRDR